MTVYAYAPDLMDKSKISAALDGVVLVKTPAGLAEAGATDTVVVDLSRPGVLEVLGDVHAQRIIGFGSHVDRERLTAARAAGCTEVLARSVFFSRLASGL